MTFTLVAVNDTILAKNFSCENSSGVDHNGFSECVDSSWVPPLPNCSMINLVNVETVADGDSSIGQTPEATTPKELEAEDPAPTPTTLVEEAEVKCLRLSGAVAEWSKALL